MFHICNAAFSDERDFAVFAKYRDGISRLENQTLAEFIPDLWVDAIDGFTV